MMVGLSKLRQEEASTPAESQVGYLAHFLRDPDPAVRVEAVRALVPLGAATVPMLLKTLSDQDAQVAREAAAALGKIGPVAAAAVPALTAALKETSLKTRLAAATALGNIGAPAAPAIPSLASAMQGSHLVLARLAAQALSRIGRPAVAALVELLQDGDHYVRREAAWALGELGPAAVDDPGQLRFSIPEPGKEVETVPETRNAKTPVIPLHKQDVIAEWREVPPPRPKAPRPDALTALHAALTDADPKVRVAALVAIECIGRCAAS